MQMPSFETLENIVKLLLPTILVIAVPVVLVIVRNLINKFTEKLSAETKSTVQDMVDNLVASGISYAEQYAKTQEKAAREKIDGSHKLEIATMYIISEINKQNLPQLNAQEISNRIDSYLGIETIERQKGNSNEEPIIP